MPRLDCSNDRWGAVDHPETGALIQLDETHPQEVCKAVAAAYEPITLADDEGEDDAPSADDSEERKYATMDYAELRQIAADADTDEIDGRSSKAEIVAYLSE